MKKKSLLNSALRIFLIILGCFIMGSAYNIFYTPHNIVLGGFGGISNIISYLLANINIHISTSVIYLILNIVLYFFAVKLLGKRFAIFALIGILGFSAFLEFCKFPPIPGEVDPLLNCIYGGIITGIGTGIIIRAGGSTGGGDMLGCVINHKHPKISVGWVTICVNFTVITISIFVFGLNLSLYALIAIAIAGKTSDLIIEGPKAVKAYYIISPLNDQIGQKILSSLKRGATVVDCYGEYSGEKKQMILCLVSGFQVNHLKNIVYDIDPNSFMFSVDVHEAMGKGFNKLESKDIKKLLISKQKVKRANPDNLPQDQNLTQSKKDI